MDRVSPKGTVSQYARRFRNYRADGSRFCSARTESAACGQTIRSVSEPRWSLGNKRERQFHGERVPDNLRGIALPGFGDAAEDAQPDHPKTPPPIQYRA